MPPPCLLGIGEGEETRLVDESEYGWKVLVRGTLQLVGAFRTGRILLEIVAGSPEVAGA